MENNNDNNRKWDKQLVVAVIAIIVGAVVTIAAPELRKLFCLEKPAPPVTGPQMEIISPKIDTPPVKPAAVPKPKPPVIHQAAQEPADPQEYTIGENKSELVKEAKARLSVSFHDDTGETTAKITIAPAGKDSIVLPTVGSGSQEFASSTGVFLVHVLNVDWNGRTVTVQVSRKE